MTIENHIKREIVMKTLMLDGYTAAEAWAVALELARISEVKEIGWRPWNFQDTFKNSQLQ